MASGAGEAVARLRSLLPTRADLDSLTWAPGRDVIAGITVALVALPLALAFGTSSGMGAAAGITTAVVAGIVAAVFGGSHLQVSGPTGAMAVVLIPIVTDHGQKAVLFVGLIAGIFLVVGAMLRFGQFARYVPLPVVEGFTAGIAIVIALQQVPLATGYSGHGDTVLRKAITSVGDFIDHPHWTDLWLTLGTVAVIVVLGLIRPGIPAAIVAVAMATALVKISDLDVSQVGSVKSAFGHFSFPSVPFGDVPDLILPALAVAMLAALESLLCATVADAMAPGTPPHDPDRELFGQGLANLVVPLVGGMPATAAIARTAVNVRTGARSRLATIVHSIVILIAVVAAAKLVADIPMAALAGVLFVTCARMVEIHSLIAIAKSGRGELLTLAATMFATVFFDLVIAVILGIVVAGGVFLVKAGQRLNVERMPLSLAPDEEHALLDQHIVSFRIDGPLFFAAATQSLVELTHLSDVRVVILRLSGITTLDATGASVLKNTVEALEHRGVTVLLSGVAPRHMTQLQSIGVFSKLAHERHIFETAEQAAEHARLHVRRVQHSPGDAA